MLTSRPGLLTLVTTAALVTSVTSCTTGSSAALTTAPSSTSRAATGPSSASPSPTDVTPSRPLQFRPVLSAEPGACPSGRTAYITDPREKTCLHLGSPSMTVTHLDSVKAVLSHGSQWAVDITLNRHDATSFGKLTTELSRHSAPGNQLAVVLGSGPTARLLTAPTVMSPLRTGQLQIVGGFTKAEAQQLVRDLGGSAAT